MKHRFLPLSTLVALGLLAGACGDDGGDETATDETTDTTADEATDSTEGDESDVDLDLDGVDVGECGFLAGAVEEFANVDPTALLGAGGPVDFGAFFAPVADAIAAVAGDAPSEIRPQFELLAATLGNIADELEGVVIDFTDPEGPDPETLAKLEALETSFTPEVDAANEEISAWVEANCPDLSDEFEGFDGLGG